MKLTKPTPQVLSEYLLVMGEEWVKETYGITSSEIDNIMYGDLLPTDDRQLKKIKIAFEKDKLEGQRRMLENYLNDHFLWDELNEKQIATQLSEDKDLVEPSEEFLKNWERLYEKLMSADMKRNNNGMKDYGWCHGERVINKTTSLTTDDEIHDRMLRMLLEGKVSTVKTTSNFVRLDHMFKTDGHGYEDENFLKNIESTDIDHVKSVIYYNISKISDINSD